MNAQEHKKIQTWLYEKLYESDKKDGWKDAIREVQKYLRTELYETDKKVEWKPIKGFEGYYEISNTGIIKNIRTGKFPKCHLLGNNLRVNLHKERSKGRGYSVKRLIAASFFDDFDESYEVVCKDFDPYNLNLENISFGTKFNTVEKMLDKDKVPRGERSGKHKLSQKQVDDIRAFLRKDNSDEAVCYLSNKCKVSFNCIDAIRRSKTWREKDETI